MFAIAVFSVTTPVPSKFTAFAVTSPVMEKALAVSSAVAVAAFPLS